MDNTISIISSCGKWILQYILGGNGLIGLDYNYVISIGNELHVIQSADIFNHFRQGLYVFPVTAVCTFNTTSIACTGLSRMNS